LILDAEGGSRFIKANRKHKKWNPLTDGAPPEADGTWDACFVQVTDWKTLYAAYQWLASGKHPFKSVVLDSLTEAQKRLVDDVAGTDQPTLQDWGTIGRNFEDIVRKFRDLTFHPTNPVSVVMLCLAHLRDGETRPFLKGAIELTLPAFVDVVGYLYTTASETDAGKVERNMLIVPHNKIIAKDRTGALEETYGAVVNKPDFSDWLDILEQEFGS